MLEALDPFALKNKFDLLNALRQELGDLGQDARFLRALLRSMLPGRRPCPSTDVFPPFELRPHPVLAGKRVGLVTSGGSGALVSLCGIKRAFEEAGIEVAAVSVCSGSAIWGSMIAAGLSAQEMVELSFSWQPSDLVDFDWRGIARLLPTAARGFAGFVKGDAVERTMERAYRGMTLAETPAACYVNVLDLDTNQLDYIGRHNHPELKLSRLVRMGIALPLFMHPVRLGGRYFADGGVVDIFPVEPLLRYEAPFDHLIGVNVIMPAGFRGEDITGWLERPLSVISASRQLYHAQWLELARQQIARAGEGFLLLEPIPYSEIVGSKFFDVFLGSERWPGMVRRAYEHTRARLSAHA